MSMKKSHKVAAWIVAAVALILLAIRLILVPSGTLQSWHKPDALQKSHIATLGKVAYPDFRAEDYRQFYQKHQTFAEYLEMERQLLEGIYAEVKTSEVKSRYHGKPHAGNFSFELQPDTITAGVLLVHGLSDSPHHIRAVAEIFKAQGCYVIGLRLPGHGSIPAALLNVERKDWSAAVEFGAAMVQRKLGSLQSKPNFYVGGFSTGGALTLRYALNAVAGNTSLIDVKFRQPDKVFLFSPAIAITKKAILANWHKLISWLPMFEKLQWSDLFKLEDDLCKYNSFPKNAADQIHLLTEENSKLVEDLKKANKLVEVPPIFAFQSNVDATVQAEALVKLYAEIGNGKSELFLFDINRSAEALSYVTDEKKNLNHTSYGLKQLNFRYTFITNRDSAPQVLAYTWQPGSQLGALANASATASLQDSWPDKTVCLSHVAIPIAPNDSLYGQASQLLSEKQLLGENDMLNERAKLVRLRYNPFFTFLEEIIRREVAPN